MKEDNKFYLPILKSKAGEFNALSKLDSYTRNRIFPLLEVTPMEWDHAYKAKPRTIHEHLTKFSQKITKFWALDDCFIDTSLLDNQMVDGISNMEYIFNRLSENTLFDIKATPVVQIGTDTTILSGIKNLFTQHGVTQIGLRITLDSLTNPSFKKLVDELLGTVALTPSSIHLILDLKASNFSETEDYSDGIVAVLEDFPYFKAWKTFSICGGAFPGSSSIHKDENIIPRYDWKLFQAIQKKLTLETFVRDLNYGDYSIVNPTYFEFDPTKMSSSANIKYTIDGNWLVIKGNSIKKSGTQQYFGQANQIATSAYFLGSNYSKGDLHIFNCANRKINAGNPNVWNWVANNHHFTKVVADLFSIQPDS